MLPASHVCFEPEVSLEKFTCYAMCPPISVSFSSGVVGSFPVGFSILASMEELLSLGLRPVVSLILLAEWAKISFFLLVLSNLIHGVAEQLAICGSG